MAFNREDLITWNELAPSLQTILRALQTNITNNTTRVNTIANKVDAFPSRQEISNMIANYITNTILPNLQDEPIIRNHTTQLNSISVAINQINNSLSTIDTTIQGLSTTVDNHINDTNPHPNYVGKADFLVYQSNTKYKVGELLHIDGIPTNYVLECVQSGSTSSIQPNFLEYLNNCLSST